MHCPDPAAAAAAHAWRGVGSLTCYHGEKEKQPPLDMQTLRNPYQIAESIEKFYDEAARRLPLHDIPKLVSCIYAGGFCFGLADPVSNIILNAIDLLASDVVEEEEEEEEDEEREPLRKKARTSYRWRELALSSHAGLLAFLKYYFRYLTDVQARRYLHLAGNDLLLAVKLVNHDRFRHCHRTPTLLPDGGTTKAAFSVAASEADHPAPDDLARLMTAKYHSQMLSPIMAKLQDGKQKLTTSDVWAIRDMLAQKWPPVAMANLEFLCRPNPNDGTGTCSTTSDGKLHLNICVGGEIHAGSISVQRIDQCNESLHTLQYISDITLDTAHLHAKLSNILEAAAAATAAAVDYDASPCDHIVSIKMCLLEAIHGFRVQAIAKLPRGDAWGRRAQLFPALVVAGHCYGPMDPVSNIILNTVWYDTAFPTPNGLLPEDIFDTAPMSRMDLRCLDGLVALLRAATGAVLSEHEAMEYLWFTRLETSHLSGLCRQRTVPFAAAAMAAKHPQHVALGSFLMSLAGEKLNRLRSLLSKSGTISDLDWEEVNRIVREEVSACGVLQTDAPKLSTKTSSAFSNKKFVRANLEKVLQIYGEQHPWEPIYKLDVIFGVEGPKGSSNIRCYHSNFLVSTNDSHASGDSTTAIAPIRTLFFAELWESKQRPGKLDKNKPFICFPVRDYCEQTAVVRTGRCSFCEDSEVKIVHPPCGTYSWSEDFINVSRWVVSSIY